MALLPRLASLWRNLTDKESVDQELNEELRAHVAACADCSSPYCWLRLSC